MGIMMLRTEKQRKDLCKDCPVARTADMMGDPCSLLVMRDLLEKPRRYSELERSLTGISSRTLSKKLQHLENEDLVTRVQTKEKHSLYKLTKKGAAFQKVVDAMRSYGKRYLK